MWLKRSGHDSRFRALHLQRDGVVAVPAGTIVDRNLNPTVKTVVACNGRFWFWFFGFKSVAITIRANDPATFPTVSPHVGWFGDRSFSVAACTKHLFFLNFFAVTVGEKAPQGL
jgi:hypothetical protein